MVPRIPAAYKNQHANNAIGNGSWAHGVAAPGKVPQPTIYGYRTWTDGPVAVSYLVDMLGVPLTSDYAYGHASGGSKFGATINNTYTNSTAGAPDAFTQLANYTSSGVSSSDISNTMHFLWIGSNDISLKHIYVWGGFEYVNQNFAANMARQTAELVQQLLDAGSNTVFVPNLYPKDISPAISFMATDANGVNASYVATLGATIDLANAAIQAALLPFGKKAIYYDVNGFMKKVMQQKKKYGITHAGTSNGLYEFCDGFSQADWDLCVTDKQGDTFYWM
jgi:phospholipase/lecithinase/hemolysin